MTLALDLPPEVRAEQAEQAAARLRELLALDPAELPA